MNKRLVSGMSKAFFDTDLIASRITLAVAEAFWAVMLFWPGDTFGRPTYSVLASIANEELWALAFAITSVLQVRFVALDECRTLFARRFAAWNAFLWIVATGSMIYAVQPPPAAIGGEVALAMSALWIYLRPMLLNRGAKYAH